ncbi:Uncharacterized protein FWK35_00024056 [Aphis craccivora]|uniref:Uncharacterized protein n=1 Tax=Aphis craccivora TaxID=307492 RepID=A0A6G0VZY2_APHCR|nr:Uncharacterized protein FWK35_00024056 [Aphis craccivora]
MNNARSLLFDVDNNYCEQFKSVINKYYILLVNELNSLKSNHTIRVHAAIVLFNSGGQYIREIHKKLRIKVQL